MESFGLGNTRATRPLQSQTKNGQWWFTFQLMGKELVIVVDVPLVQGQAEMAVDVVECCFAAGQHVNGVPGLGRDAVIERRQR